MDDIDIDIEEHNVFDNPRIRTIFPDISQIKTEVPDYKSDPDEHVGYSSQICYEDNLLEDDYCDEFNDDSHEMDFDEATATPSFNFYSNKIIIGSKPSLTTEVVLPETDLYIAALNSNTRVCLENWDTILKTNPCFCKDCGTLFATINALDAHKMISHSFLIEVDEDKVVERNYAKKSTVVRKTFSGQQCSHCKLMFPDVDALTRHLYEILGVKDNDDEMEESSSEQAVNTLYKCPQCGCIFIRVKAFIKHLKCNHGYLGTDPLKFAIPPLPYPLLLECAYCLSRTSSLKSHNAHVQNKHQNLYFNINQKTVGYKCLQCKVHFEKYSEARYHRKKMHQNMSSQHILKRIVRKSVIAKAVDTKLKTQTSTNVENEVKQAPRRHLDVTLYKQSRTIEITNTPIPKSVMFRCKKCSLHFISASLTMKHINICLMRCSRRIKCKQCNRMVRIEDRYVHDYQHKVSNKIKVYDISNRVLDRTLCKCPKCDICYEDRNFWTHFDSCGESESFYCKKCDILVSALNIEAHKLKHGNAVNDFIIIDFVSLDDRKTVVTYKNKKGQVLPKNEKGQVLPKKVSKKAKSMIYKASILNKNVKGEAKIRNKTQGKKKPKMTLRYCDICECSFASLRHLKIFPECTKILKEVCPYCGLYFTTSMYKRHKNVHKLTDITLHDFKFVDFIKSRTVIPKAPEYPKCPKCNVYFVNKAQIVMHDCRKELFKVCGECSKKFSPHAFMLHTQFHLYGKLAQKNEIDISEDMPVLLQKYESLKKMWNILYSCEVCKTMTDNYDHAVEHSQNHLNNIVNNNKANLKKCKHCGYDFELKAYLRHMKLHNGTNLDIKRNPFKILKYNYLNFLKSSWFEMFGDLPKEHANYLISRSMYKKTRNVRMKVLRIGPGPMFYQCATCKHYIDENSVYHHTHNEMCSLEVVPKAPHVGKHSRIISFKDRLDAEFNSTLKIKIINAPNKELAVVNNPKGVGKLYDVYQCDKCGITLIHRQNTGRHICVNRKAWHCNKCDLPYLIQRKHEQFHLTLPNFNKHTINVISFSSSGYNPYTNPNYKPVRKYPSKITSKIKNKVLKPAVPNSVPVTKLYKCKCGLHFTSMLTIAKHFDLCTREKIPSSECSKCNLLFPFDILVSHLIKHHRESDRKIVVELVEPPIKQVKLFECARCSLLFPNRIDAIKHLDCGTNNGKRCHGCNKIFHTDSFEAHKCTEYIKNDIITVNDTDNEFVVYDVIGDAISKKVDSRDSIYEIEQTVFKCAPCNLHFTNLASWYLHAEIGHVMKRRPAKCKMCQLKYNSSKALVYHQKMHHKNRANDFHVQVMDSDAVDVANSSNATSKFVLDVVFDQEVGEKYGVSQKMYTMMLKSHYDNNLYKCHRCPQHFVTKATWLKHIYCPTNHDMQSAMKCPECEYTFTEASLMKHQFIHHHKMKLKKEELKVVKFTDTGLRHLNKSDYTESTNDLNKADLPTIADSNDVVIESAAKKTKYDSDVAMNCIDDENVVSSSTKDFM